MDGKNQARWPQEQMEEKKREEVRGKLLVGEAEGEK